MTTPETIAVALSIGFPLYLLAKDFKNRCHHDWLNPHFTNEPDARICGKCYRRKYVEPTR